MNHCHTMAATSYGLCSKLKTVAFAFVATSLFAPIIWMNRKEQLLQTVLRTNSNSSTDFQAGCHLLTESPTVSILEFRYRQNREVESYATKHQLSIFHIVVIIPLSLLIYF